MEAKNTKISLIRGAFLNPFELQNYSPLAEKYDLQAVSSLHPISADIQIPLIKLFSPTDLPNFPLKYQIINRLITDIHYLHKLSEAIAGSDIAHVAETYYHYTNQAIKAKKNGLVKKVVSTVWEIIPHNNESIRGRKHFKRQAYKHVDHFFAVTKLAKNTLIKEGVPPQKITVIPMGVDVERFSPAKKHKSKKSIQILFIGRLVSEKGIGELYRSFSHLIKNNYPLTLNIIGRGPIKPPNLPGITISTLPYSQIQKAYNQADIFCLPSKPSKHWQEQYGMVLVEAMACGLPIVTTSTGAIPEVCGSAALYSKPGDEKGLTRNLKRLITNPALRQKMSSLSRKRALDRYDSRQVAKKIDQLYQQVLNQ